MVVACVSLTRTSVELMALSDKTLGAMKQSVCVGEMSDRQGSAVKFVSNTGCHGPKSVIKGAI